MRENLLENEHFDTILGGTHFILVMVLCEFLFSVSDIKIVYEDLDKFLFSSVRILKWYAHMFKIMYECIRN